MKLIIFVSLFAIALFGKIVVADDVQPAPVAAVAGFNPPAPHHPEVNDGDIDGEVGKQLSLYHYKPIYFLMGNPYTKVELSFETQLVENVPVYFGYTQLFLWDLFINSPYFYDLNYNPLFWYRFWLNKTNPEWIDAIPIEHESNGRGGVEEKSWNRVAVAYHRTDSVGEGKKLASDLKFWVPVSYNQNNLDLSQYRGLWEMNLTFSGFLGSLFAFDDVTFRIYPGGPSLLDPTAGGQELTIRLRSKFRAFLPLATFQVFHGYGEYLQDYSISHWGVRGGISF